MRFTVPEALAGKRFDIVLAALAPQFSRARHQRWIRDGLATVQQRCRRPRDPVEAGDLIELQPPDEHAASPRLAAQPIGLAIRHEDEAVIVIDKPAGMVVHPGAGRPDRTLVNALVHHDSRLAAIPRAGLVHRLDKDTTGLLVVARTLAAHKSLVEQLAARTMGREYLAVVRGRVIAGGVVDRPIGRHRVHRTRRAVVPSGGRRAVTHYRVESRYRVHTRLSVRLDTGRTHQIRVHLAHLGFPVVGDRDYGGRSRTRGRRLAPPRRRPSPFRTAGAARPHPDSAPSGDRCRVRMDGAAARRSRGAPRGARRRLGPVPPRTRGRSVNARAGLRPIVPDWPAPERVRAASTTRKGGTSRGPWDTLNLAEHVADDGAAVRRNRARLRHALDLPEEPRWLDQRHGRRVVDARDAAPGAPADGIVARSPHLVCAVLTADCMPVLVCDRDATVVAALHAGWRGIAAGIIEAGVGAAGPPGRLMAWLGPAIGPGRYEVGADVRDAILAGDSGARGAFRPSGAPRRWYADLERIVRRRLERCGVVSVHGGGLCTASSPDRFFSHRRDGVTGRMASLVWLA